MSKSNIPNDLKPWIEAKKKHRLSQMHIQMARELGMNPKSFGKIDNHKQEKWKAPLSEFIEHLYMERFDKEAPEKVLSFEEIAKAKVQQKLAAKERKAAKKVATALPASNESNFPAPQNEHMLFMKEAIEFAQITDPLRPFGAILVDSNGKILSKAADCTFISPLFHAEALAIHALITTKPCERHGKLTMYTTCEPNTLSMSALYWSAKEHNLCIEKIVYGSTLSFIKKIWTFGVNIKAKEFIKRTNIPHIALRGPFMEKECNKLFNSANERLAEVNSAHPLRDLLPKNMEAFYKIC